MDSIIQFISQNSFFEIIMKNAYQWILVSGIKIIVLVLVALVGLRIVHVILSRVIKAAIEKTYTIKNETAIAKRAETIEAIFHYTIRIVVWVLLGLMILSEIGVDIGPLLAAAGVAGLALGFGGQFLIRDLIAGFFIILEDQYRKGDVVTIAGTSGLVEEITLRKTILRDLDGIQHHVPNGEIKTASNFTKLWSRAHLNIGIAYDAPLEKAIEILNKIGKEMAEENEWKDKITKPIEVMGVDKFADSAVELKVLGETKPIEQWGVMREYRKRVKLAFDAQGIEIPYPHRTIVQKNIKQ
jgi:moderate conductance mechanosensitive channel